MAYGVPPKNTHSLPAGRRGFTEVVRPSTYGDGQHRDGTPAGNQHHTTGTGYLDAAARAHRESEGTQPYPTQNNPATHGKAVKRYGVDGRELDGATHKSTGDSPASRQRDEIAPSLPQRSQPRASETSEQVGWVNDKYIAPTHPNSGRHYGGHVSGSHANTDNASGQAHSASGGKFGKPQVRPTGRPPGPGVERGDSGALDRKSYTGAKRSRGK